MVHQSAPPVFPVLQFWRIMPLRSIEVSNPLRIRIPPAPSYHFEYEKTADLTVTVTFWMIRNSIPGIHPSDFVASFFRSFLGEFAKYSARLHGIPHVKLAEPIPRKNTSRGCWLLWRKNQFGLPSPVEGYGRVEFGCWYMLIIVNINTSESCFSLHI